jgi:AraC-like DNA-binding protein
MKNADIWDRIDPVGEALHLLRMDGVVYCRSEFSAPFGLAMPPMPDCLAFHFVTAGSCWLDAAGDPVLLQAGDFVLVPHGEGHCLLSAPGEPAQGLFDLPREIHGERYEVLHHGGGGAATSVICGAVRFDDATARRLVGLLPRLLRMGAMDLHHLDLVQSALRCMAAESRCPMPGGEAVITRLADILVIQSIRSWINHDPAAQTGWLAALKDKKVGRALALIHKDPARNWTLAGLAAEVAMSRSAFAARFTALVGEPLLQYITAWKMQLAASALQEQHLPLIDVAARVGYQSEAAFCRAYKRSTGMTPGSARAASALANRQEAIG